jgi:hypothetical protein
VPLCQTVFIFCLTFTKLKLIFSVRYAGLLRAVAREIFNVCSITCDVIKQGEITLTDGSSRYFTDFSVTWLMTHAKKADALKLLTPPQNTNSISPMTLTPDVPSPSTFTHLTTTAPISGAGSRWREGANISVKSLCHIFPFHLIFDSDLRLQQCGSYMGRILGQSLIDRQVDLTETFTLLHPRMPFTFQNLCLFINAAYIFELEGSILPMNDRENDHSNPNDNSSSTMSLSTNISNRSSSSIGSKTVTNWQSRALSTTLILKGQ